MNQPIYYYKNNRLAVMRTLRSLARFYVGRKLDQKKQAFWQAVDAA